MLRYLSWSAETDLTLVENCNSFLLLVVAQEKVNPELRWSACQHLIAAGARYVCVWGEDCELWHDEFDWANLRSKNFALPNERDLVMTTWHDNESLAETMRFAKTCAVHPAWKFDMTIILHVGRQSAEQKLVEQYEDV